jgi:hypothetical protein
MKYIFILILSIIFFSNCNIERKLYSPAQVNNPSLEKKNDYSVSLSYSSPSGFDFNGGYAITNRWAIIGGLYSHKNRDKEEESNIFSNRNSASSLLLYKHNGFHIGTGFYLPISQKKSPEFISFFGGYTKGKFEMRESFVENIIFTPPPVPLATPKLNFYKSDINRWFLQGSLNLYHDQIHQSFITRFNYVGYDNINTDYTPNEQVSFNLPDVGDPKWSSFLDFSFDTKIFFSKEQRLGLQLFGTVSTRLNKEDFNFYYYPFRGGIGIVLKSSFIAQQKK